MIRKLFTKYILFLGIIFLPLGGVYFIFQSVNQLSQALTSLSDDFTNQQTNEKRHYLEQLVSLIEMNQKELEQEIKTHILDGELGELIGNSQYGEAYSLHLESYLKAITEQLDLEQVVIFNQGGVILAGYSDKPFLGASGLVEGGNIGFSYRTVIENAFISREIAFYDQFPSNGYNKKILALAFILPLRDSNQRIVGGFGTTRQINPDALFSNYRRIMGQYAPTPALFTNILQENKEQYISHAITNHHGETIASIGIENNIVIPGSIQTTLIMAGHINKFCLYSIYIMLAFAAAVFIIFLAEFLILFTRKKEKNVPLFQDARLLFEKSRQKAIDDIYYFT